jgi:cell pole-organizing protein PopZ
MTTKEGPPDDGKDSTSDNRSPAEITESTMAAIAQLVALRREQARRVKQPQTLEDIMCETLRPIMSKWLDDTGPKLVECLVRSELGRVLRQD